jgi:hypothetical protein
MSGQVEREAEAYERREQSNPRWQLASVGQERNKNCAAKRGQKNQRKNRVVH